MTVAVLMGSKSDFELVKPALAVLKKFGIKTNVRVLSAHRTPIQVHNFVKDAEANGTEVFITAAGKAAHLGGVVAAFTIRPVIGLPIASSTTSGFDSLLSMVQMPSGVPVAVVALNGAENAGLLAVQMLAIKDKTLSDKLYAYKTEMEGKVLKDDAEVQRLALDI